MKFAIISDIHLGPVTQGVGVKDGIQRKLLKHSEEYVKEFVQNMNELEKPEFVVNLGDSIEDIKERESDIKFYKQSISMLSKLEMPLYHVVGNHDRRTLDNDDIKKILRYDNLSYSFDYKDFHFVVLDFQIIGKHIKDVSDIRSIIPESELEWFRKDMQSSDKPTIVFMHYSLADQDLTGSFWFENTPQHCLIGNRKEIRQLFESTGKVKAVINGHLHWNRMNVHANIPYFTVTSIVENFNNDGIATNAYTIVNLDVKGIELDIRGNDSAKFEYEFKN